MSFKGGAFRVGTKIKGFEMLPDWELEERRRHLSSMAARLASSCAQIDDWVGALIWQAHLFWIHSDEWLVAQRSGGIV